MKKKYFVHGIHAGDIPCLIQVSKNGYVYNGFTIRKSPRNSINMRDTYLINKRDNEGSVDNYYGKDFALSEACETINRILKNGRVISA